MSDVPKASMPPGGVSLEPAHCALGCGPGETTVLHAPDRLHGLPGRFRVVRCATCGLMRTDPRPGPSVMHHFYPSDYKPHLDTRVAPGAPAPLPTPGRRKPSRNDPLNHAIPEMPPGRLLEVGCASGRFLQEMAGQGWDVTGLEASADAGRAAQALGFPVFVGSLEAAPELAGPYDLIVGWMVVEHLHDPVLALRKLHAAARPGGRLAISTPDAGSWEFRFFKDAWYALQVPTHLFHFTPETLRRVLAAGGWTVERVIWQRNAQNLLQSLRYRCLDHGWTRLAAWLEEVIAGRRAARWVRRLARLLGRFRASGRITVWALRDESLPAAP